MVSSNRLRPARTRRRGSTGFTILEVAMATAVLSLAIGSSLVVLGRGFNSMDTTRCLSYASQILQSELEKTRLTTWGDGTTAGTGTTGVSAYPTVETTIPRSALVNSVDVGTRMTVTRIAADVHAGMIRITYTVRWTTIDGQPMARSYTTYYGKDGLYDYFII